jgi:glyceraldehyde-3-phosphate dehydrogenase (NADP+)
MKSIAEFVFLCLQLFTVVQFTLASSDDFRCAVKNPVQISPSDERYGTRPNVNGAKTFYNGIIDDYTGAYQPVTSPIIDSSTGKRAVIGKIAQMKKDELNDIVKSAEDAWKNGQGVWPQMTIHERITAIEKVVVSLKEKREEIVNVLMWEICKSLDDARAEFDRTMTFIESVITALKDMDTNEGNWTTVSGILAKIRRAAIGIVLILGPFNYPFNETYATLIPALLMGNVIIMKLPTTGGLAHILTMEAYAKHLPPGVINFISGSGRELLSPLMSTGKIDVLAFIGGSNAADKIIKSHPNPHRLKVFLQLEGKNLGIVLPDADLTTAVEQITIGSTTYNGQRCTAIKLVFVHKSLIEEFLPLFAQRVAQLKWGLPWSAEGKVAITPLPENEKVASMESLIYDAINHGAKVINSDEEKGGCDIHGELMRPAIVYPVTSSMRLWTEEQFGPVIPVAVYENISEILQYLHDTHYGQQAAVFTSDSSEESAHLIDVLSTAVGRININTQCGRSPDSLPFSGRRSSAMGTMSVTESLKVFSTEVVVAGKQSKKNEEILKGYEATSKFLSPLSSKMKNSGSGDKPMEL